MENRDSYSYINTRGKSQFVDCLMFLKCHALIPLCSCTLQNGTYILNVLWMLYDQWYEIIKLWDQRLQRDVGNVVHNQDEYPVKNEGECQGWY